MLAIKRVPLLCSRHGPIQFIAVLGLLGHVFPKKLPLPLRESSPHVTHSSSDQAHSSSQMVSQSVQPFLCGYQMLCCTMHCQWGQETPKLPHLLGILSPCQRRIEPWPYDICTKTLVKITRVVLEISSRTEDRQTDWHTHRNTHQNTSQQLPQAK